MVDKGIAYGQSVGGFLESLRRLSENEAYDRVSTIGSSVGRFAAALQEIEEQRQLLLSQAQSTMVTGLLEFCRTDVRAVQETGKAYHKLINDLDTVRSKFAAISKGKPVELEEQANMLQATQTVCMHVSERYF